MIRPLRSLSPLSVVAGVAFLLGSFSPIASAQTSGDDDPAERLPAVTFGAGMGPLASGELGISVVVQHFLSLRLVVEADFLRWNRNESRVVSTTIYGTQTFHRQRSGWAVGANLVFRTQPRRVSWFGGGGIGILETFDHDRYVIEGCVPPPSDPHRCQGLSFSTNKFRTQQIVLRALTGADVRILGRVSGYGLVEVAGIEGYLLFSGGLRVEVFSRDPVRR